MAEDPKQHELLLMKVEVFYRCPECGDSYETTYENEAGVYSARIFGVVAYLCQKCGHGVAVVQSRVHALEAP